MKHSMITESLQSNKHNQSEWVGKTDFFWPKGSYQMLTQQDLFRSFSWAEENDKCQHNTDERVLS